tara:strand:- start:10627 stop:11202 length:576 start_codon:yes stop_codon:yes gene_type:complete
MENEKTSPNTLTPDLTEKLRQEYVQGVTNEKGERVYPSIDVLVAKHNVAKATLFRRSQSQDWKGQRTRFELELAQQKDTAKRDELAKESINFDGRNLNLAKALQTQISHLLQNAMREIADNNLRRPFTPVALERLANALSVTQKIGRLSLGDSTENTSINATITQESAVREVYEFIDELANAKRSGGESLH